jgi:hypothetical protein
VSHINPILEREVQNPKVLLKPYPHGDILLLGDGEYGWGDVFRNKLVEPWGMPKLCGLPVTNAQVNAIVE